MRTWFSRLLVSETRPTTSLTCNGTEMRRERLRAACVSSRGLCRGQRARSKQKRAIGQLTDESLDVVFRVVG